MAVILIPIPVSDGTAFKLSADLDGTLYTFDFNWNPRGQWWTLNLYDAGGDPVMQGIRCVVDYSLLAHCSAENAPEGQLRLIDTADTKTDPKFNDLGSRVVLTYVTA